MKTRILLAALLLLAFGSLKAQNPKVEQYSDTIIIVTPDKAEFDKLMMEYNNNLHRLHDSIDWKRIQEEIRQASREMQRAYDSVDWEQFERDMEKWSAEMEKWSRKMEKWSDRIERRHGDRNYGYDNGRPDAKKDDSKKDESKDRRPEKKNLLLDAHWAGFEAGLNIPFSTTPGVQNLDTRPMRCWYFGLNIVDVGVAFEKRHIAGLFTGVGIGWCNYSWNNRMEMHYDQAEGVYAFLPILEDKDVKNTKYGALYLQVPLMLEVRPTRHMYIDAGVTGGLRIAQWNRVRFTDRSQYKYYYNGANQFKLDASFRIGGENVGFFANYAILPLFSMEDTEVHPLTFGFSLVF